MADPPRNPVLNPTAPAPARESEESGPSQILTAEGCFICRRISTWDEKYRFWFLHENYSFPETLERLTHSLGFCFFHGAQAALDPSGQSSLTFVHNVLARRVGTIISRDLSRRSTGKGSIPPFAVPDPCPACKDRDDATGRALFSLVSEIEPAESDCRTLMGSLCFPHFRVLVSRLSLPVLLRILPLYETALSSAMDALSEENDKTAGEWSIRGIENNDPLRLAHRLAAGEEVNAKFFPPLNKEKAISTFRNPVTNFLEDLSAADACPVCKEMDRAWTEWMAWLADNLPRGMEVRDLLPVCPAHLRATLRLSNRHLVAAAVRNALNLARNQVRQGLMALSPSPLPNSRKSLFRLGRLRHREERPFPEVRRSLGRPLPCPVCHRLSVARDRALLLLFALIESPQHQARFEGGYGLCLRHFSRSLLLKPSEMVSAILAEVEAARLALLQWELEESLRKDAWMYRPEAAGTEHTAWRRAVQRFSGSFGERSG